MSPELKMEPMRNEIRQSYLEAKTLEITENIVEGRPTLAKILAERRKRREEGEENYELQLDNQRDETIRKMHEKFSY